MNLHFYAYFPVPSAPPTTVIIFHVTFSSITVQWGPVNCIQRNGDITGYSVRYGAQGDGNTQTVSVSGGNTTKITISGLHSSTVYAIEVAAVNSAGIGPYSVPSTETTDGMFHCTSLVTCHTFSIQSPRGGWTCIT